MKRAFVKRGCPNDASSNCFAICSQTGRSPRLQRGYTFCSSLALHGCSVVSDNSPEPKILTPADCVKSFGCRVHSDPWGRNPSMRCCRDHCRFAFASPQPLRVSRSNSALLSPNLDLDRKSAPSFSFSQKTFDTRPVNWASSSSPCRGPRPRSDLERSKWEPADALPYCERQAWKHGIFKCNHPR